MMLKSGMVVRDRHGRTLRLMGRNACNLAIWWGHRLKPDGKVNKQSMPVLAESDVVAVRTKSGGFRGILPGILK